MSNLHFCFESQNPSSEDFDKYIATIKLLEKSKNYISSADKQSKKMVTIEKIAARYRSLFYTYNISADTFCNYLYPADRGNYRYAIDVFVYLSLLFGQDNQREPLTESLFYLEDQDLRNSIKEALVKSDHIFNFIDTKADPEFHSTSPMGLALHEKYYVPIYPSAKLEKEGRKPSYISIKLLTEKIMNFYMMALMGTDEFIVLKKPSPIVLRVAQKLIRVIYEIHYNRLAIPYELLSLLTRKDEYNLDEILIELESLIDRILEGSPIKICIEHLPVVPCGDENCKNDNNAFFCLVQRPAINEFNHVWLLYTKGIDVEQFSYKPEKQTCNYTYMRCNSFEDALQKWVDNNEHKKWLDNDIKHAIQNKEAEVEAARLESAWYAEEGCYYLGFEE